MDSGASLGPYRIDRELGAGGMGRVYAATGPDGVVALKIVHPHLLEQPGFFKRFLREADIGKSVRHDNVVRTLDCDQLVSGGQANAFLVMEYVEGQTLSELLGELERVPEELCRHVAREICKGLAAVHDAGVVHRDLKPENVIIARSGATRGDGVAERPDGGAVARDRNVRRSDDFVVKIMDLGVALVADEAMRLSKSGAFVGSVEYAAPEQFKGGDVDGRTDLHALGVLLYELATGSPPYRGDSFHEILGRVCDEDPRRLGEIDPQLSAYFEELVHTLLVKDPRGRFASATQLLEVLEHGEDSAWWSERAKTLRATTDRPVRRIRIPRTTAVFGRTRELALLRTLFDRAADGDGQVLLIEGEAGIGKTRLVDEFVATLRGEDVHFEFLFGGYSPGGAATALGGLSSAFREHFGEDGSARHLSRTPLLVPAFDAVLRGEPAPPGAVELSTDALGTCFVRATRSLTTSRPAIVLVDDLHFATDEARRVFATLATAAADMQVLLIGTLRPGTCDAWATGLASTDRARRLELSRLGPEDVRTLLDDALRTPWLTDDVADRIVRRAGGNPFYVFELLRGLRDSGGLERTDDGTWRATPAIDAFQVPPSLRDLVRVRVDALTQAERDVVEAAACCGFEFDPHCIAEVLGLPRIELLRTLARIERDHRLVRATGRSYEFDHHQVQEALYSSLSELMREELHAAIGDALERQHQRAGSDADDVPGGAAAELCAHFLRSAEVGRAAPYLNAALSHLQGANNAGETIELCERALRAPGLLVASERFEVLLRMNGLLDVVGRRAEQAGAQDEALSLAREMGDRAAVARAELAMAFHLWSTSEFTRAEELARHCVEVMRELGDRDGEYQALRAVGVSLYRRALLDGAREVFTECLEVTRLSGDVDAEAASSINLGNVLLSTGDEDGARKLYERGRELAESCGNRRWAAAALGNLGGVCTNLHQMEQALKYFEQYVEVAVSIGLRGGEAMGYIGVANALQRLGRLSDALVRSRRAEAIAREVGDRNAEAIALVNRGEWLVKVGDVQGARDALQRALDLSRQIGTRNPEGFALFSLASVATEEGDLERARSLADEALALRIELGDPNCIMESHLQSGALAAALGDPVAARSSFDVAIEIAEARDMPAYGAEARVLRACLPDDDSATEIADARAVVAESQSPRGHFTLWQITGDRDLLDAAHDLVKEQCENAPEEFRNSIRENVRVHRAILAAWREEFGEEGDAPEGAAPDETPTRAGDPLT